MRDVIVETLQRRNSIDIVDKDGRSPFLAALSHGVSEVEVYILGELLLASARTDIQTLHEDTSFTLAAVMLLRKRTSIACLKFLLEAVHCVDLNAHSVGGFTALQYCAIANCAEAVALLLHNKDINIDAIASGAAAGGTAVYLSVMFGTTAVLRLLVDAGASIEFPDKYMFYPTGQVSHLVKRTSC